MRLTASSMRSMLTSPAATSSSSKSWNCRDENGSMNMSVPALTPVRTFKGVSAPGVVGSGI